MSGPPTAIIFPGQGSQTASMRDSVVRERPELLDLAVQVVGEDPFARVHEGTHFAQPAIFCASLAGFAAVHEPGAELMAGHSLGELAALTGAGALRLEDGLRLVALRGRLMHEAGERGGGGMLAIVRGGAEAATPLAERHGLTLANDNSPDQVVLSGARGAIEAAAADAKASGLRALLLPVAGAFHSPLMEPAVAEFRRALDRVELFRPAATVLSATTAEPFEDIPRQLAEAVTKPVRWRQTLLALHQRGVRRFVETGPGKVLTGLVRRTLPDVEAQAADDLEPARA